MENENSQDSVIDQFEIFVDLSRDLARIQVRKSFLIEELVNRLKSFGGVALWLSLIALAGFGIVFFSSKQTNWAWIAALCCGTFISYIALTQSIIGIYSNLYLFLKNSSAESYIYKETVDKMVNKITLFGVLPMLILAIGFMGYRFPSAVLFVFQILLLITLASFLMGQLMYSLRLSSDYYRLTKVLVGRTTAITLSSEQLIKEIALSISNLNIKRSRVKALRHLATNNLRYAEVRLELTNLILAITAIVISVLFSEALRNLITKLFNIISNVITTFSLALSDLLRFSDTLGNLFTLGVIIGLWWLLVNNLIGIGFFLFRGLLYVYHFVYRPAYAFHQAIVLLDENDNNS